MADGLNRVTLLGNLGADPEFHPNGGGVLKLRLATTESYQTQNGERKERTDWHSVVIFGKRAESLAKFLAKGSKLYVEGRLQTSSYEKDGQKVWKTEVVCSNVILCGGKSEAGIQRAPAAAARGTSRPIQESDAYGGADPGDDIPF